MFSRWETEKVIKEPKNGICRYVVDIEEDN